MSVLNTYASIRKFFGGRFVHTCIVKFGMASLLEVTNSLVHMYGMCGSVEDAWSVFYDIQHPDVVSWNLMIAACAQEDLLMKLLIIFMKCSMHMWSQFELFFSTC